MKTPFLKTVWSIVRKDLRMEFRSRELVSSMGLFALLSILIFSFALELDRVARGEAISGVLWVTVVFASILGLNRSLAMERDGGNLDAMLIAPIDRTAIFGGKLVGNFIFTLIVGLVLLPVMTILYNVDLVRPSLLAHFIARHTRFFHNWHTAGNHDRPDARPRKPVAHRYAAYRLAGTVVGCARFHQHPHRYRQWKTGLPGRKFSLLSILSISFCVFCCLNMSSRNKSHRKTRLTIAKYGNRG